MSTNSNRVLLADYIQGMSSSRNYVANPSSLINTADIVVANSATVGRNTTVPLTRISDTQMQLPNNTTGSVSFNLKPQDLFLSGQNCEATITYTSSALAAGVQFQVRSGSNILVSTPLIDTSIPRTLRLNIPCGDLTDTRTLVVANTSTTAGISIINAADLYYGKATNIGTSNDTTNWTDYPMTLGAVTTAPTRGTVTLEKAQWRKVGGDMEIRFDYRQSSAGTAGSGIYLFSLPPGFVVDTNRLPGRAGLAEITTVGNGKISPTGSSDGVTTAPLTVLYSGSFPNRVYLNYITSGETTASIGSAAYPMSSSIYSISFMAKLPIQGWNAEGGFRPDTTAWKANANISGANINIPSGAASSYTEITSSTLSITNNPGTGNTPLRIGCSGTNPPSGAFCTSGDESLAVEVTVPRAGDLEVCFNFAYYVPPSTGAGFTAFQVVETPVNAQTILAEGRQRIQVGAGIGAFDAGFGTQICGEFTVASAGAKMFRLMYEKGATSASPIIFADAAPASGQRDINVTVRPLNQITPAPFISNTVVQPGSGIDNLVRVTFGGSTVDGSNCTGSPCTVWRTNLPASVVSRTATGDYTLTLPSGTYSERPNCQITAISASSLGMNGCVAVPASSTTINFLCRRTTTEAPHDISANIICSGAR